MLLIGGMQYLSADYGCPVAVPCSGFADKAGARTMPATYYTCHAPTDPGFSGEHWQVPYKGYLKIDSSLGLTIRWLVFNVPVLIECTVAKSSHSISEKVVLNPFTPFLLYR
jgi:hypothetical protein